MNQNIAIYTLTSELHNAKALAVTTKVFLSALDVSYDLRGSDYSDYGSHLLHIIYVRTGGTEGTFRQLLPELQTRSSQPFYLLTSGKSNSLAASMEILSYLRQHEIRGEILHGSPQYISRRIAMLVTVAEANKRLNATRLALVGQPSDWLISSHVNRSTVKARLGISIVDIPMQALLDRIATQPEEEPDGVNDSWPLKTDNAKVQQAIPGAYRIYRALKQLVADYRLQGFTLRCFDLLTAVKNTGCMALARLNAEGYCAGCEGDMPALLTMTIARSLLGVSGFQANPASIDPEIGQIVFAHCTIPFDMVERYEADTHFESGIGVGIRGYMAEGPVTIFKLSGNLSRHFIAEGTLMRNEAKPDLCRTQQVIQLADKSQTDYFLKQPIGNHHIIVPGHHLELLEMLL